MSGKVVVAKHQGDKHEEKNLLKVNDQRAGVGQI